MHWVPYRRLVATGHLRPYIKIRVVEPFQGQASCVCLCLLDTGADVSALPQDAVDTLQLVPTGLKSVKAYSDETPKIKNTYSANLTIFGVEFCGLEVLPMPSHVGLIGRDVLNMFFLKLDGPKARFKEGRFF